MSKPSSLFDWMVELALSVLVKAKCFSLLTAQYATEVMTLQVIFGHTQSSSQPMEIKEDVVWDCFVCAQSVSVTSHFGSVRINQLIICQKEFLSAISSVPRPNHSIRLDGFDSLRSTALNGIGHNRSDRS